MQRVDPRAFRDSPSLENRYAVKAVGFFGM
jgi:hypothetical protein